jgi:hypothetical protein
MIKKILAIDIHNEYLKEHFYLLIHLMINERFHYLNLIKSIFKKLIK